MRQDIAPMDARTRIRAFARVGAAAAVAGEDDVAREIRAALDSGVDPAEVREVLLQSVLFVGYPRAINALIAFRDVLGDADVAQPPEDEPADLERWRARGQGLCARIYGGSFERLLANMLRLHPELAEWMVTDGYGKVLSRPGLDARDRELAVLGILAAGGHDRQLASHVRGALNMGASAGEVTDAVECVDGLAGAEASRVARTVLADTLGPPDEEDSRG